MRQPRMCENQPQDSGQPRGPVSFVMTLQGGQIHITVGQKLAGFDPADLVFDQIAEFLALFLVDRGPQVLASTGHLQTKTPWATSEIPLAQLQQTSWGSRASMPSGSSG
jgi:hypothetical protein